MFFNDIRNYPACSTLKRLCAFALSKDFVRDLPDADLPCRASSARVPDIPWLYLFLHHNLTSLGTVRMIAPLRTDD